MGETAKRAGNINLDNLQSLTAAGQAVIHVTLDDATPPDQVGESWYQARKKVGDMLTTLPAGVRGPFFNDDFGDTFGIIYAFTAEGFSDREVRDWAYEARTRLLQLENIGKVGLGSLEAAVEEMLERPIDDRCGTSGRQGEFVIIR